MDCWHIRRSRKPHVLQQAGRGSVTAETPRADAIASLVAAPVSDAIGSLEVRWIFRGQLEGAVAGLWR